MEQLTEKEEELIKTTMKSQLKDVVLDISIARIAYTYFGKSSAWMYHKLEGKDSHGNYTEFTSTEKKQLKEALLDLSGRIAAAAESIK